MTADSQGNVIPIKIMGSEKLANDFLQPRMNIKEEIRPDNLTDTNNGDIKSKPNGVSNQVNVVDTNDKEGDKTILKKRDDKKRRNLGSIMVPRLLNDTKNSVIFIENKLEEEKHSGNKPPAVLKENRFIIQPAGSNFE